MRVKSKTDVITNSSTEVFICAPKEGMTSEELIKKIPFFRLTQFSYPKYMEWVKLYRAEEEKLKEQDDWIDPDNFEAPGYKDDENSMYSSIFSNCPDPVNKNKAYWELFIGYLFDPREFEIRVDHYEMGGETYEYKHYPELKTPTPLILEFRDWIKAKTEEVKAMEPDPEKPWEKSHKETFLRTYVDDEGKMFWESDYMQKEYLSYNARYLLEDIDQWVMDRESQFPPIEKLIKTQRTRIPTTPDDLEGDCIDFWSDDCCNPSDDDWEKIKELTEYTFCTRIE